jgi:hypothetical protein
MKTVNKQKCCSNNLSVCHFGLALGMTYGLCVLVIAYVSMFSDMLMPFAKFLQSLLPGFSLTWVGGLIGFAWGFAKGIVTGYLIAFFYNFFNKHCCCSKACDMKKCDTKK